MRYVRTLCIILSMSGALVGCPDSSSDPNPSGSDDGGATISDGGATASDAGPMTTDAGTGLDPNQYTEYGSGEYGLYLSQDESPRRYCWYIEETVRICRSPPSRRDFFNDICRDDETNCLANQPSDSENDDGACWTRITYDNVSNGPLYGSCDRLDAYRANLSTTQCLFHRHCPEGRLCVDYQCYCPPDTECGCFECGPLMPARCDGNVLVTQRFGPGCDENDRCYTEDVRTDCSATQGTCSAAQGECVGGQTETDAGVTDADISLPDAGDSPDAGCLCPPVAPPSCNQDTIETQVCNPTNCMVTTLQTDCTASFQVCDPDTVTCVQCRVAEDCPGPGPLPPGMCADTTCNNNMCNSMVVPC